MYISRLLAVGSAAIAFAAAAPSPAQIEKRATNFQFFGVCESGAEFGAGVFPGVKGTDYTWPNTAAIDTLIGNGMNTFRVAFSMERLTPNKLTGSLDSAYFADLENTIDHITGKGAYAVLDPHNYMRYYGNVITNVSAFQTWWKTVATHFAGNSKVIFDCNNEPHDMPSIDLVVQLNQACINGIRAAGATSQYIFVEGSSWSGAWTWVSSGNSALAALTDPQNKIIYEMHQYLDSDGSGTSVNCVSNTIGAERLAAATAWLKANNKKGIIGEFAGGANPQCKNAIEGMLAHLAQNSDVWTGALWWAAGTWWADYMYSYEPSSGTGYTYYKNTLGQYAGNGQSSNPTTSSVNTSPTSTKSAPPTSTSAAGGGGSGGTVAKWGQCAGVGYTGPTVCVSGTKCTFNNEWYSQCL